MFLSKCVCFFALKGVRLNSWNQTLLKSPFTTYGIFYGDRRWVITNLQLNTIVGCPWGLPPIYGHSNFKGVPPYVLRPQMRPWYWASPERRSIMTNFMVFGSRFVKASLAKGPAPMMQPEIWHMLHMAFSSPVCFFALVQPRHILPRPWTRCMNVWWQVWNIFGMNIQWQIMTFSCHVLQSSFGFRATKRESRD